MEIRTADSAADLGAARALIRRSMEEDQSYGYRLDWHWDVEHAQEVYVVNPRNVLLVAVADGVVVGTAAVRVGGPSSPPHHPDLGRRYADRSSVAQLLRVITAPEVRRRGVARRLVAAAVRWAAAEGGYRVLCLHTNARVPGAASFWRSTGATLVRDDAGWETDPAFHTLHFEFGLDPSVGATRGGDPRPSEDNG